MLLTLAAVVGEALTPEEFPNEDAFSDGFNQGVREAKDAIYDSLVGLLSRNKYNAAEKEEIRAFARVLFETADGPFAGLEFSEAK